MVEEPRRAYEALRAGHVAEVRAALTDHVARLDWPSERIDRYRTERLRALLVLTHVVGYASVVGRLACGLDGDRASRPSPVGVMTTSATAP
jgi:hypothetical protein